MSYSKGFSPVGAIFGGFFVVSACIALVQMFLLFSPVSPMSLNSNTELAELRFQNWNLRFDSKPDSLSIEETIESLNSTIPNDDEIDYYGIPTEVPWSRRRIDIANDVLFNKPVVFTVNEALVRQVRDLDELLGSDFEWVGVGRNDGRESSEFQAVFYNTKKVKVLSWDTFWLSYTPFEPSKFPGAGSYRSATAVRLRTVDGLKFTILNAHLDDQSEEQRRLGGSLLRYRGAFEFEQQAGPVFLLGDFNSQSSGRSCGAYNLVTGNEDYVEMNSEFVDKYKSSIYKSFTFDDIMAATPVESRLGHHATFTSFRALGITRAFSRIDFQFGGNAHNGEKKWTAIRYKVGEMWYDDRYHLSDHRPVITDVVIEN
ncbi:unnamed protein product [Kuraishia capsulata CBS 1993]|uniref:Endonuclease/exonuclease/phosphatase domain-containing protein n=1 Tax=Kuraishia capsulata CBS 1993 TaxID=1382522 RepID=W6MSE9_9ASCO|nr:uncharacterized protein KUCA_T00005627001 [Kuraishia capsulata CBS 1993]CDK29634.1 unnamed protein product [Kuraishia capsulata CBS 1993]